MKALTRTREVGGSLIVTIPKEIVKEKDLRGDELVELDVDKVRKSGFGILRGMRSFTKKDELKGQLEK